MRSTNPFLQVWLMTVALSWLAGGCGTESLPGPVLSGVCVPGGNDTCRDWIYAGEPVEVGLLGRHFHTVAEVDLDKQDNPLLDDRFEARIGSVSVEGLDLAPGLRDGQQMLIGWLPASLSVGSHDVEITAPSGQQSHLDDAFTVRTPLQTSFSCDKPRLPAGAMVHLSIHIQNNGAVPLTEVTTRVDQAGAGGIDPPATPEPFTLGSRQSLSIGLVTQAAATGQVLLSLSTSARAGGIVRVETDTPAEAALLVLSPAELTASVRMVPASVRAGESFTLVAQVHNQGDTPAQQIHLLPPSLSGTGTVELQGPPPAAATLPAGADRELDWPGVAHAPGQVVFDVQLGAVEAISGRRIGPLDAGSVQLEIE